MISKTSYKSFMKIVEDYEKQDIKDQIKNPDATPIDWKSSLVRSFNDQITGMSKPYMFMGEYLASIMARHEWLKAVRGNDYSTRENLENIFNRMRLPGSEGLVDRDSKDKKVFIIETCCEEK